MTNESARKKIEALKPLQIKCVHLPCPRCGYDLMDEKPVRNALSRHADVYVCNKCGMDEAIRDMCGEVLPLTEWGYIK